MSPVVLAKTGAALADSRLDLSVRGLRRTGRS